MHRTFLALLALLLLTAPFAAPAAAQSAKESESGHRYPVTVQGTAKADEAAQEGGEQAKKPAPPVLDLFGLAIREKTIFNVNVYSYVLYVDRAFTAEKLAQFAGLKLSKLEKKKELFDLLLQQNATKELRLRFCRSVDTEDIVSAFEDSLKPRMLARKKAAKGSEAEKLATLNRFRGFFSLDQLKKGNELRFTWHPDGTLSTVVNGVRKPDLMAPDLAASLFDVYLGAKPITKSGKKKLIRRLPEVLASVAPKKAR